MILNISRHFICRRVKARGCEGTGTPRGFVQPQGSLLRLSLRPLPAARCRKLREMGHLYASTLANANPALQPTDPLVLAPDCNFLRFHALSSETCQLHGIYGHIV
jgi:hypothetical protein